MNCASQEPFTFERDDDTTENRRISSRSLVADILATVEFSEFQNGVFSQFADTHVQNRKCMMVGNFVGKDVETARRWLHGITTPKARDFWPIALVCIMQNLPIATQRQVAASIKEISGVDLLRPDLMSEAPA